MKRRTLLFGATSICLSATLGKQALSKTSEDLFVPAEEERHGLTFMQWPVSREVYTDHAFLRHVQQTIAEIANTIAAFEPVVLLAAAEEHPRARKDLSSAVQLWDLPTDDLWCRDSGPVFAKRPDGQLVVSHIQFNGWGNKQEHRHDARIAGKVAERLGLPLIASGLKGEAGGVEQDGAGLLMAHKSSWLNDNRNPTMSRGELEKRLLCAYGAERMIWSPGLKDQDITDYHIDSLARFTGPGRVLINLPLAPDPDDPFHRAALQTHAHLLAQDLEVDVIHESSRRRIRGDDFVASYVNYYICNDAIIAAQFGDPEKDQEAVEALQRHYPNREIVTLNVDALGEIGGGIHCATQQMPEA